MICPECGFDNSECELDGQTVGIEIHYCDPNYCCECGYCFDADYDDFLSYAPNPK